MHTPTQEELKKEFAYLKGNSLYDDTDWICEQAKNFSNHYTNKKMILEKLKSEAHNSTTTVK